MNTRTLGMVLAMEEPNEMRTLTAFRRYTDKDGAEWADLGFESMGLGAPLDAVPADWSPFIGSEVMLWGKGFGWPVRGVAVDGKLLYYRTEEEQEAKHRLEVAAYHQKQRDDFEREGRAKLDADYTALPPIFQARIDKFRRNNPEFRWKYEGYEMFCCVEAVKLALALGSQADEIAAFVRLDYDQQKLAVPDLAYDEHSGNTFGAAVTLARLYASEKPALVEQMHGALAPLVGSEEYGCVRPSTDKET